ncbi:hypothetical protein Acid345_4137 [Candidatus Koribacter versatilis Ellin345]|uniref:DUF4397 domain-containing protein n=1 Tax=Koribacter versatilis (strain Ellin345) TaxID=204669 RepID=Q1IJ13_KORVE|nr:DUF4397 domain-containing protein [Candidatus Koribacter versatilis]ABF43137.1 hypothetical protein Acid345_4137 [Candidatus Koribacter versatilis Ellin345]
MKKFAPLALVLILGMLFAAACGGGSSKTTTSELRVVNAVYDSFFAGGGYDVLVDTSAFSTALAYKGASNYTSVASGSHQVEVRNTGTTADLINQTISVTGGSSYTYVIAGSGINPAGLLLTDTTTAATSGNIQFRIVNGNPNFGAMDVFFVAPGTDLFSVTANDANLGPGATGGYHTVPAGTYAIYITQQGTKAPPYLYTGSIELKSGAVTTFVITGPSSSAIGTPLDFLQLTDVAASTK